LKKAGLKNNSLIKGGFVGGEVYKSVSFEN